MTATVDKETLAMGLDVGSTTVKIAVLDSGDRILYHSYERHYSEVRKTILDTISNALGRFGDGLATLSVTGSGGIGAARLLDIPFTQEVVAGTTAIRRFLPRTNVAIELGGEDAKLSFFDAGIDQRMNETCAGGTGAFIDQMANFLDTDPMGLNELAKRHKTLYPIAARCGVFAKTDILPLLNEGAAKEDIAASIFQSVVDQTVGGLACGRRIRGNVAFLGGPLFFFSELRRRFIETLKLLPQEAVCPGEAQLYVAMGAALVSRENAPVPLAGVLAKADALRDAEIPPEIDHLPPLFENEAELREFKKRHAAAKLPRADWPVGGEVFLGMDAGSTTTKLVALDGEARLLYSSYGHNRGNPLKSAMEALAGFYREAPEGVVVAKCGVTGYGEALIQAALGFDLGEVETVAHYKAAASFDSEVSFIVDIGGQDIKCLSVKNGVIEKLMLNEACSSGCGSFLENFAQTLGLDAAGFAAGALMSRRPADLGSRCTVFMNSKVKQAQKEGTSIGDISAGLSYSVVRNALHKVIRISRTEELGERIVVQGGTFFNDAVLRCFELSIGKNVVRPDIAGLMGAYGAALLAMEERGENKNPSGLMGRESLARFEVATSNHRCGKCENRCLLTLNRFSDGRKFVSGNRCEKGAGHKTGAASAIDAIAKTAGLGNISETLAKLPKIGSSFSDRHSELDDLPNLFSKNLERLFDFHKPLPANEARGRVGIPRALGMFETYPYWFAFFHSLGFRVELSPPSGKDLFNRALETIPSQSVCYPAKMAHGHVLALLARRPDFVFFPCSPLEIPGPYKTADRYNCPLVGAYPEVIRLNLDAIGDSGITFLAPFLDLASPIGKLAKRLRKELSFLRLGEDETKAALKKAWEAQRDYRAHVRHLGEKALAGLRKTGRKAIVLAGHPYHLDPGVNHGIPDLITANGLGVLSADSIDHLAPPDPGFRVRDQWIPHSRLYRAAMVCAANDELELVQLNSFGCGIDAVTTDQVSEILRHQNKIHTLIKIDEGANLGAARIRVRSLLAAIRAGGRRGEKKETPKEPYRFSPRKFERERAKKMTLLCPQMAPVHWSFIKPAFAPLGYDLKIVPDMGREAVEEGLKYVNNDACYPALVSIGQMLRELKVGGHDLDNTAVLMSQTGGACRASNYTAFLRRALNESGMGMVPVASLPLPGGGGDKGLTLDFAAYKRIIIGILCGDVLQRLTLASRPYEKTKGDSEGLFSKWVEKASVAVEKGDKARFKKDVLEMVRDFESLNLRPPTRPKVGVVGEILINYHPEANNQCVRVIEEEGGQALLPELMDFILYCVYDNVFRADAMSGSKIKKWIASYFIGVIEKLRAPLRAALEKHPRFGHLNAFEELKKTGESLV
ncbi:MAG: acyl-CoA dehydratase activase-related protein, partial [Deltaproteobacteria bacterium]|nr:acyl-CoA dehydratase activase-related protein [Deltaproteobacteria bacterium]